MIRDRTPESPSWKTKILAILIRQNSTCARSHEVSNKSLGINCIQMTFSACLRNQDVLFRMNVMREQ